MKSPRKSLSQTYRQPTLATSGAKSSPLKLEANSMIGAGLMSVYGFDEYEVGCSAPFVHIVSMNFVGVSDLCDFSPMRL